METPYGDLLRTIQLHAIKKTHNFLKIRSNLLEFLSTNFKWTYERVLHAETIKVTCKVKIVRWSSTSKTP